MDDEDLRRALSAPSRAGGDVSAGIESAMRATRRFRNWVRCLAALAIATGTGTVLLFGYAVAAAVLPPIDASLAGLLWFPLGVAAALVVTTAALALMAVGRSN